jgi:hypothetical protein
MRVILSEAKEPYLRAWLLRFAQDDDSSSLPPAMADPPDSAPGGSVG